VEAILASDEVKGDPIGSVSTVGVLQQIILAISYLSKVCIPIFVSEIQGHLCCAIRVCYLETVRRLSSTTCVVSFEEPKP
jgi:hypothetical protein